MSDDQRSWWDFDPDERPVPLDPIGEAVAIEAEAIVESQRQEIIREDTDPTGQTLAALREAAASPLSGGDSEQEPASLRRVALVLLSVGCVAMFSLGWVQGAAAAEDARFSADARVGAPTNTNATTESNEGSGTGGRIGRTNREVLEP